MVKQLKRCVFLLIACLALGLSYADAKEYKNQGQTSVLSVSNLHPDVEKLIEHGKQLLGRRYRSHAGGFTLDCSGFVSYAFAKLDIKLPRSSSSMSSATQSIKTSEVRPGDLLFFKGRSTRSGRVGHVALVVDVKGDNIMMMHSSTSRGVIIEPYNSAYYAKRFVGAGRVASLADRVEAAN